MNFYIASSAISLLDAAVANSDSPSGNGLVPPAGPSSFLVIAAVVIILAGVFWWIDRNKGSSKLASFKSKRK